MYSTLQSTVQKAVIAATLAPIKGSGLLSKETAATNPHGQLYQLLNTTYTNMTQANYKQSISPI